MASQVNEVPLVVSMNTILNQGHVLQLHSATKQSAKLTEILFVEIHERTNKEFQSKKKVQAGFHLTIDLCTKCFNP